MASIHEKKYLKNYAAPLFLIETIDITFEITEASTAVTAVSRFAKNPALADNHSPLILDAENLQIESVIADGMILLPDEYAYDGRILKLNQTPDTFSLEIKTRLKPEKNTSLEGLYKSGDIICTQCEAEGFRKITPFLDRPDIMARYTCTIIADKSRYPVLLSNGNPVKSGDLDGNRHYVRWEDPFKKPSYLFALVAGDLEVLSDFYTTMSGRKIDLKIYADKKNIDQCYHAMKSLKESMKWDEERFHLEYDLDLYQIVTINDFNAGAMENKGLNIFNSKYVLAQPEIATDEDFMNVQGVIGHEYFHNWTGNRVTLKNWFQLSLKEGLTVFRDQEFSSDLNSRGVKRISSVRNLRAYQFPEDSGPMTHPVRPESYIEMNNFYTMTVYEKGAEVIRMIHQLIGENNFQKGMQIYFERFDGQAVTIEDFVSCMEAGGSIDLTQFKLWYSQSGTPTIKITRKYHPDEKKLELTFEQIILPDRNQKNKKPLHIPVRINIIGPDGRELLSADQELIELKKEIQSFTYEKIPKGALPSFFRQFSAPVKVVTDFSNEETAFLMGHDKDEFNKWDAAQTLFVTEIKRLVALIRKNQELNLDTNLAGAFSQALNDSTLDPAFLSRMLTLPTEMELKDAFDIVDVGAIHLARKSLEKMIADQLKDSFFEQVDRCSKADPLSISHKDMAYRSLKNLCLAYLGSLKEKQTTDLILDHFSQSQNMTDELAAFKVLCEISTDTKTRAVKVFYKNWEKDPLVLDKWFAIQAGSTLADTTQCVMDLMHHPQFSMNNPNKVRSLFFMYAMFNPVHFHDISGKGYQLISDTVLALDKINHQIAARLAASFNHWKKYDTERQELMKNELERISREPALSRNVYEIVSRALE